MPYTAGSKLTTPEVIVKIRPRRQIEGISSVLVSFCEDGSIDFDTLAENILRTADAGLTPAVNMELGYVQRLTPKERRQVLALASDVMVAQPFVCGAYVSDNGDGINMYREAMDEITQDGGLPVLFPSKHLSSLDSAGLVATFEALTKDNQPLIAYEVDSSVLPNGRLFTREEFHGIMAIPSVKGIRHKSLSRRMEWERLSMRDYARPDFKIYSGNDLAIDMMMYGSDYFLSVSACCPQAFAMRDRYWKEGDARFYEVNDVLQSLGMFAFRPPFESSRHSVTQMLRIRARVDSDLTAPEEIRRSESDLEILTKISERLDYLLHIGHMHS